MNRLISTLCILTMFLAAPVNISAKTPDVGTFKKDKSTRNTQELFVILCENTTTKKELSPKKQCDFGNGTSSNASVAEITGSDGAAGGSITIAAGEAGKATLTIDLTVSVGNDINTDGSEPEKVTVKITIYVLVVPCDRYHRPTTPVTLPPAEDFPKAAEPAKEATPTPTPKPKPSGGGASQPAGGTASQPKTGAPKQVTPTPTPSPLGQKKLAPRRRQHQARPTRRLSEVS